MTELVEILKVNRLSAMNVLQIFKRTADSQAEQAPPELKRESSLEAEKPAEGKEPSSDSEAQAADSSRLPQWLLSLKNLIPQRDTSEAASCSKTAGPQEGDANGGAKTDKKQTSTAGQTTLTSKIKELLSSDPGSNSSPALSDGVSVDDGEDQIWSTSLADFQPSKTGKLQFHLDDNAVPRHRSATRSRRTGTFQKRENSLHRQGALKRQQTGGGRSREAIQTASLKPDSPSSARRSLSMPPPVRMDAETFHKDLNEYWQEEVNKYGGLENLPQCGRQLIL